MATHKAGDRVRLGPPKPQRRLLVRAHLRNGAGHHIATRDIAYSTETDQPGFLMLDEQQNVIAAPTDQDQIITSIYRLVFFRENYQAQATWIRRRKYASGEIVVDFAGHIQKARNAGTSGNNEPAWNDAGGTTKDGSITWADQGVVSEIGIATLLVLDTHTGRILIPAGGKRVDVQADFLQLLDSPSRHGISCDMRIESRGGVKPAPFYRSFQVGARLDANGLQPAPNAVELLDRGVPGALDAAFQRGIDKSYGRHDDSHSNPLETDDALHIELPSQHSDDDRSPVQVRLKSQSLAVKKASAITPLPFYVFVFTVRLEPADMPGAGDRRLKTFGGNDQYEAPVELGRTFIQRPDPELISPDPLTADLSTHSRWLLHVFGIHSKVAMTEWDSRRQDYHRSLNLARGGRPISFFPAVNRDEAQGYWVMSYRAIDFYAADDRNDVHLRFVAADNGGAPDERFPTIFPQSLCFWQSMTAAPDSVVLSAVFPQIETHTGDKLICDLHLQRAFGAGGADNVQSPNLLNAEILNQLSGVAMSFARPITAIAPPPPPAPQPVQRVRMGSLDVQFAASDTNFDGALYWMGLRRTPPPGPRGIPQSFLRPLGSPTAQVPPSLQDESGAPDGVIAFCDVAFAVADLAPGGQDDPPDEEYVPDRLNDRNGLIYSIPSRFSVPEEQVETAIEAHFHRPRPLVIGTSSAAPSAENYYLRVREDLVPLSTQALRLSVISRKGAAPPNPADASGNSDQPCAPEARNRHAVLLDREPFLVAQVRYPDFSTTAPDSGVIAEWSSEDTTGAAWQLRFNESPFCLVLPPQGIGDEWVKSKEANDPASYPAPPVPLGTPPLVPPTGFNFSPPTALTVDPRVAATNFSEAPWNLRRILGTPGQPGAGPGVVSMQIELLYGLSCNVDKPAVRLAEIFSRIGKIPGRRDPLMAWTATDAQKQAYLDSRKEWAVLYRRYLSRVAVLEPWNNLLPTDTDITPELNQAVSCQFRLPPYSNLADPTQILSDKPQKTTSLRGGATWGFESANIYNAVVKPTPPASALSSSADLANIALSSEGGWGHVEAGFQGNLTRIIADVNLARVSRYQLERLGRIGVFWNLAKHVIVYERVVAPSRQFQSDQDGFYGWPVVRKVEEYVQILEETRSFPDTTVSSTSATDDAAMRQARGFIAHCAFTKENRFNVKSAWGTDINNAGKDRGWKVPLWQPGAAPADIYPKKQPSLGVVSRLAGKSAIIPADVAEPQNLFFYTQTSVTRPGTADNTPSPDPHAWGPVAGVDYINAPLPAPAPPSEFASGERRTFSADETHEPPAYRPCTFRLERPSTPCDLMTERFGKPMSAFLDSVTMVRSIPGTINGQWTTIADVETKVHQLYSKVLSQIPADLAPGDPVPASAKAAIANLVKAGTNTFDDLNQAVTAAKTVVGNVQKINVGAFEADLKTAALQRLNDALNSAHAPLDELRDDVTNFVGDSADAAVAILQRVNNTVTQQLLLVESLPGASAEMVARYADRVASLYTEVSNEIVAIRALIQASAANLTAAASRVAALRTRVNELRQTLITLGRQMPASWMPDPGAAVVKALDPYFQKANDAFTPLMTALQTNVNAALTALNTFDTTFKVAMAPDALRGFLNSALGQTIAGTDIPTVVANLRAKAWDADAVVKQWNSAVNAAIVQVKTAAVGTVKQVLIAQHDVLIQQLSPGGFVQNIINGLVPPAAAVTALNDFLKGPVSDVEGALDGAETALNNIVSDAQIGLDQLKARLEQERDNLTKAARSYLDQAAAGLADTGVLQAADTGLRLVRAFGDPPRVPQLDFERSKVGYYFNQLAPNVNLSPVVSVVNQGAAVLDALKPLGLKLPTTQLLDQLIPPDLKNFDVSKIFPNFAGLDLSHLFNGLKLPDSISKDNIKVTHGLDAQTQRAFVQTDVQFKLTDPATIFAAGPLILSLPQGGFKASTLITADRSGITRKANGELSGDWQLCIGGMVLLVLKQTKLTFDDAGGLHFSVDPHNIQMPGILEFITNLLQQFTPSGSGLSVGLLPDGFQSVLNLPLPDLNFGAFGISNLSLGCYFAIRYSGDFKLQLGANLARRDAPFSLTVFILGGGGFFETAADYTPSNGTITCHADVGITVSASLAIALGPIKGGVYAYLGITASFSSGQGGGLTMGIMFMLHGEVSVLSIVSASITLLLEANYGNGALIGHGRLTISIKICWCFTLEVNEEVTWHLAGGSSGQQSRLNPAGEHVYVAMNEPALVGWGGNGLAASDGPGPMAAAFAQSRRRVDDDVFSLAAHLYVSSLV
jgi:hypothetical protein